jgi:hypothetical protein
MSRKRFYVRSAAPPVSLNLTDAEIDAIARILHILGDIPDRRRMIDVAAMAVKIAVIEEDDPRWGPLRAACGLGEREPLATGCGDG